MEADGIAGRGDLVGAAGKTGLPGLRTTAMLRTDFRMTWGGCILKPAYKSEERRALMCACSSDKCHYALDRDIKHVGHLCKCFVSSKYRV